MGLGHSYRVPWSWSWTDRHHIPVVLGQSGVWLKAGPLDQGFNCSCVTRCLVLNLSVLVSHGVECSHGLT